MPEKPAPRKRKAEKINILYSGNDASRVVEDDDSAFPYEKFRSPFRRDYARLIHSPSFRRLQGKTQVFPGSESDYFRNRLTHSLEVAQIAKSIAIRLNHTHPFFRKNPIDTDIVEFAGLAHDLGHPPFGHNGEQALDELMLDYGGFEGNAQTLRILSRVEKKKVKELTEGRHAPFSTDGHDLRAGLDLTFRSLASILKYDSEIKPRSSDRPSSVQKGYYADDAALVASIKEHVCGVIVPEFKTIECWIMDTADDIAYSTYDLEDNFKAGFLSPSSIFALSEDVIEKTVDKINERANKYYPKEHKNQIKVADVYNILYQVFDDLFKLDNEKVRVLQDQDMSVESRIMLASTLTKQVSDRIKNDGYERTSLTSRLVQQSLDNIEVKMHQYHPALSKVRLKYEHFKTVETLKNITFNSAIMSPKMQVVEYRGKDIVKSIFKAIEDRSGELLLPDDYRLIYRLSDGSQRKRVISDFVAGMTDRYAVEFYSRICGSGHVSVFKPH